jgi:hypothetical protein
MLWPRSNRGTLTTLIIHYIVMNDSQEPVQQRYPHNSRRDVAKAQPDVEPVQQRYPHNPYLQGIQRALGGCQRPHESHLPLPGGIRGASIPGHSCRTGG